jgi:hypothetical protein|mmetsp:Transcript_11704/g.11338  ORF Transcript_11704/g.11338 Transcript_11704/m.11338 type:complete len:103 (-) Transcript_11704:652-960(-)|eukprot:CAMPEP_0119051382 /NCGR_PEP_ID=MMETSP1177-20130426/73018_1 /TAXON_ID=2985 /ORGANISM="Ochromonas sp, Strain CCMP1899" /LENGTH=102 /DNA_ID=CAMNT_0007030567 /DNA_START=120 /DNA_END=428 /DNA_ORIENTATION=+
MAEEGRSPTKEKNPQSDAFNWDARVKKELDAPHQWNGTWGEYFKPSVPSNYSERTKFLEQELKTMQDVGRPVKYGVGAPFQEISQKDYRRKKTALLDGIMPE